MATLAEIKVQLDAVNGAIAAWELAATAASADAATAASAGAQAQTAQQTADASAALAGEKRATAKAEARKLSDLLNEPAPPPLRRKG